MTECPACANGEGHSLEESETCPAERICPLCPNPKDWNALLCPTCIVGTANEARGIREGREQREAMREMVNSPVARERLR